MPNTKKSAPKYELFGEQLTLTELAEVAGVSKTTTFARIKAGWTPERIATTPTSNRSAAVGDVFGRLMIVAPASKGSSNKTRWLCACACGTANVIVREGDMKSGLTTSCGCVKSERIRQTRFQNAEDFTGRVMKSGGVVLGRSPGSLPRANGQHHALWLCRCPCGNTFEAVGSNIRSGSQTRCSIRCPDKTRTTSEKNKKRTKRFAVGGVQMTLDEIAASIGMTKPAIVYRMKRMGMTLEEAISRPRLRAIHS